MDRLPEYTHVGRVWTYCKSITTFCSAFHNLSRPKKASPEQTLASSGFAPPIVFFLNLSSFIPLNRILMGTAVPAAAADFVGCNYKRERNTLSYSGGHAAAAAKRQ
jgi:hypothetical protein